jgi:hypothetical protein
MKTQNGFDDVIAQATKAAEEAGQKWVDEHTKPVFAVYNADVLTGKQYGPCLGTMLDVCGMVHIRITDKRTAFSKYIKKIQNGYNGAIFLKHKYSGRQEWGLNEACAYAAAKVFTLAGIKGIYVYSNID